jgi:hypothetical protein
MDLQPGSSCNTNGRNHMAADIINLKRARKAKARDIAAQAAAENRARHGRTKAEREQTRAEADLTARRLEQARREEPET